jgi:hypothetical protein
LAYANRCTQYPTIKNAPLPADGAGTDSFSNALLFSILGGVPLYFSWKIGGGLKTTLFLALFTTLPLLAAFWIIVSTMSPRKNEKAKFPGRPIEHYLTFKKPADKAKYSGRAKIPMDTFHEMYFDGDVDFNGDCLEVLEYRHDWASFRFTYGLIKFFLTGMIPEVIMHTRSQGKSITLPDAEPMYCSRRANVRVTRRGTSARPLRPWRRLLRLVPRPAHDLHLGRYQRHQPRGNSGGAPG